MPVLSQSIRGQVAEYIADIVVTRAQRGRDDLARFST